MEKYGRNSGIPLLDNSRRYYAIQPLVEDIIPRFIFWHHHEYGLHLVQEWVKVLYGYFDLGEHDFLNWEDTRVKFSLEGVHQDYGLN